MIEYNLKKYRNTFKMIEVTSKTTLKSRSMENCDFFPNILPSKWGRNPRWPVGRKKTTTGLTTTTTKNATNAIKRSIAQRESETKELERKNTNKSESGDIWPPDGTCSSSTVQTFDSKEKKKRNWPPQKKIQRNPLHRGLSANADE